MHRHESRLVAACVIVLSCLAWTIRADAADAKSIAAGEFNTCAITSTGGVKCWGENYYGQVGDGTTTGRSTPTAVSGLSVGVASITVGADHACALTTSGGLTCWGYNMSGQLGDGTTSDRWTPVDVTGLATGVAAVSAGRDHTCALTTAGGIKCWGDNSDGQLGDGGTFPRQTPVDVFGLSSGVVALSAGADHTCAVTTGGGLKCWGDNLEGQLGDGTTSSSSTPVDVSGLSGGVTAVAAGGHETCAMLAGGDLKCWGDNSSGQIGDGTTANRSTPTAVSGLGGSVASFVVGAAHACALTTAGVKCWGANESGQLGDGTMTSRATPLAVSGPMAGIEALAAGGAHTCALTAGGGLRCWGSDSAGQIGRGRGLGRSVPGDVFGLTSGVAVISANFGHTCAVTTAGGAWCWGRNGDGQLGDGTTTSRATPTLVLGLDSGVSNVATGNAHTCAVTTGGAVKCWGSNYRGGLGDGTTASRLAPVDVSGLGSGVAALAAGGLRTCALTSAGGVKCWGLNMFGQLGDGTTTDRTTPTDVPGLTTGVASIAAGFYHTCAVLTGGGSKCWGWNTMKQLGDGTSTNRLTAVDVTGLTSGVASVTAGLAHTCALTTGGGVKCWGWNAYSQLGDGTTTGVATVSAGFDHTCAVTTGGGVKCWGLNGAGQLGDGTTTNRLTAVDVTGLTGGVVGITGGDSHTCALTTAGGVKCWGKGYDGELGDPRYGPAPTPTSALGFGRADFDADDKIDVAVYRPATGTWFSLDSSSSNTTYRYRGWGVQAQNDTPVVGDFDGDGINDPTVFRPASGTWFILESHAGFTTWSYFGWGNSTDILVPGDYDGDGIADAAVYRPSNGIWYVRPSNGAASWNVAFGNATDLPIAGDFDGDGNRDPAVYRASTGTWFWLKSSTNFTTYDHKGWGVDAQGDAPAPGDYDGDGKTDLCVFRPEHGTWYILESHAAFTTWQHFGWGAIGDTPVPADYDGDGMTDGAIYRASTHEWYIRPSSGGPQWSFVFGQAGDVPLR